MHRELTSCFLTILNQSDLSLDGCRHGVRAESVEVGASHVGGAAVQHLQQVDGGVQVEPGAKNRGSVLSLYLFV